VGKVMAYIQVRVVRKTLQIEPKAEKLVETHYQKPAARVEGLNASQSVLSFVSSDCVRQCSSLEFFEI
jgi:hypothetical protein